MLIGFSIAFTLQMLVMFGPLGSIFNIQAVSLMTLVMSAGVMSIAILAIAELHKVIVRKFYPEQNAPADHR